jgi:arginine repressor
VKTTVHKSEHGNYKVHLRTCGGNKSGSSIRKREENDYDILFVLDGDDNAYVIPTDKFDSKSFLTLGKKYVGYKLCTNI